MFHYFHIFQNFCAEIFSNFIDSFPSAIEITEENLEDLLAYDDLFLDYFNTFLALPVSHFKQTPHNIGLIRNNSKGKKKYNFRPYTFQVRLN